ncbi:Annexin [Sesbania bispinosa]|nr:Annexin [Sesbania bispinosa]
MATLIAPPNHSPLEDAEALRKAVKGWGADGKGIIAILGHRNATQRTQIREAYHDLFQEDLIKRLESELSGDFELLVGLVSSFRYDGNEINARLAQSEADVLHEAIKDKNQNHEEVIRILTTRSKTQLVATFNRYRDDHGIAITKKLSDEASDNFHKAVHLAISCINDHKKYYEKVLRNAIESVGTDEDALTRVIVSRAEKDLKDIKEVYYKRNSVHLEHAVAKETSGDYTKFLLALLGKED